MRIALACPYDWHAPGGVQVHVRQLAGYLREQGHETLVLTPASGRVADPGVLVVGRPVRIRFNASVVPLSPYPRNRSRVGRALARFRPDVVHAHEPFAPSIGLFATMAARVPVVATSHTYADRSRVLGAVAPLLRRVWSRPRIWLAVSGANASFLARHVDGDIRIVPNGLDTGAFEAPVPAELPPGRRLVFVGRLDPRKGFPVAIRAFDILAREMPEARLVVVGDGPDRGTVRSLPAAIRERVLMVGARPHDLIPGYLAAAEVYLGPATGRESFGMVLVEALAAGVPVVASDIAGYREVARNGEEALLVPPGDAAAVAAAAKRILDDPDLAARLSETGRRRARRYRWEVVGREIEAAYRDALER